MNANALLALISDLYAQLCAAQDRIAELESELQGGEGEAEAGEEAPPAPAPLRSTKTGT